MSLFDAWMKARVRDRHARCLAKRYPWDIGCWPNDAETAMREIERLLPAYAEVHVWHDRESDTWHCTTRERDGIV